MQDQVLNAIGSEEHQSAEVLHVAQKHGDKCISIEFGRTSLGKKEIGFIEEQDGIPSLNPLENVAEVALCLFGTYTLFACTDGI